MSELTGIAGALSGQRVVLIKASGFIGGRLLQALKAADIPVVALTRDRHGGAAAGPRGPSR